ncbi:hypothetical protein K445DRAFT_314017 [Daldinia sp. EC12]|nr:GroES-like protein [Daldinia eschscholtzii]OTB19144.1 hypothetical protein K445DRAFT_314017 [Daldinia sp. EC12]
MATHLAAFLPEKGQPIEVREKQTLKPGPDELLIDVKAIALNPIDWKQRDFGFAIASYPAVIGSDISGVVLEAGSNVSATFKPGTRATAFAPTFFAQGAPDYGAFQQRPIIPATNAAPIPDYLSFKEAAILPMAYATTWAGWSTIGVPRTTPSDKQGLLVWGGSSSVGSAVIQSAKLLGFTVYTTASAKHHEYVKSLGASKVFDYKEPNIEDAIIKAGKEDGLTFQYGYDAVGATQSCQTILKALKGNGTAHLASAPHPSPDAPTIEGVEAKFVAAAVDENARKEQFSFIFNTWLKERLEKREIVPSPRIQVVEGGLHGINKGLDILKAGVSATKLVLEL